MEKDDFHSILYKKINLYVHKIYDIAKTFPREEMFGLTSQLKRAGLSVMLNYIEGYARKRKAVLKNFFEISYGSLKESKYLVLFSYERKFLSSKDFEEFDRLADEIGAMLWGTISKINS